MRKGGAGSISSWFRSKLPSYPPWMRKKVPEKEPVIQPAIAEPVIELTKEEQKNKRIQEIAKQKELLQYYVNHDMMSADVYAVQIQLLNKEVDDLKLSDNPGSLFE